ncbi:MAG TPA: hypothetical protein VF824_02595 [Thermoanaerobaculia bacterium]|jgi:sporulation protein YlmC with PRC-barrel domain
MIVHLETLIGREVVDADGRRAGRIEEARARQSGKELVITEFLLAHGRLERTSFLLHQLLAHVSPKSIRVPWEKLDLSDPRKPRLTCRVDEL